MSQLLQFKVKPRSHQAGVAVEDGLLVVRVRAVPEKGKANREVVSLLADFFRIPEASVVLKKGLFSKVKTACIPDHIDISNYTGGTDG